jgi:hypothetical protein
MFYQKNRRRKILKKQKVVITTFAVLFLMLIFASPTLACATNANSITKIPFTHTVYYIGVVMGETTSHGDIILTKGGTTQAITLDGTLISNSENILKIINTVTGKGFALGEFTDTYTNSIIGTGVMKGVAHSKISAADGSAGTCSIVAYGNTDKYSSIKEFSEASWHPTSTPFPTIVLTVTGYYIVQ